MNQVRSNTTSPSRLRLHRPGPTVVVLATITALVATQGIGAIVPALYVNAAVAIAAAIAGVLAFQAARSRRGSLRYAWLFITIAAIADGGASMLGIVSPTSETADFAYVIELPAAIAGAALFLGSNVGQRDRWSAVVDYAAVVAAIALISREAGLAMAPRDVVLVALMLLLLARGREVAPIGLVAGLIVGPVADMATMAMANVGAGVDAWSFEPAWVIAYGLIAWGASKATVKASAAVESDTSSLLPRAWWAVYLMPGLAAVVTVLQEVVGDGLTRIDTLLLLFLAGCAVARQFLAAKTHVRTASELRISEAELHRLVSHDALTDLPNRGLFTRRVDAAPEDIKVHGGVLAILFIDLDDFKAVNDTWGHAAGDRLLLDVAARLTHAVRDQDVAARFGGDEFAILLDGVTDQATALDIADRIAGRLGGGANGDALISASIGIAMSESEALTGEELLRRADVAMYAAKGRGRGGSMLYRSDIESLAPDGWHRELEAALDEGQYELFYQPIVAVDDAVIQGFEALIRWRHPERGLIPPVEFIPDLEATDLIVDVGTWVLREACRQLALWRTETGSDLTMSVNVSPRQLRRASFAATVRSAIEASGIPAAALTIELTETCMVTDARSAAVSLRAIRDLGVRIALDDFGTGFSSLSFLRDFPVDIVKVDRSLVSDLDVTGVGQGLTRALLLIAADLGLSAVAEGVETTSQRATLKHLGCELAQGYLFAKPLTAEAAGESLRASRLPVGAGHTTAA